MCQDGSKRGQVGRVGRVVLVEDFRCIIDHVPGFAGMCQDGSKRGQVGRVGRVVLVEDFRCIIDWFDEAKAFLFVKPQDIADMASCGGTGVPRAR